MPDYISHPRILPDTLEKKGFQVELAESAKGKNSLVVLPTGLGKTIVAVLVIADHLEKGKILFLAPTKPLAIQHAETLQKFLIAEVGTILGTTLAKKRSQIFDSSEVIVSTPETVESDIAEGRYSLYDLSLIIFDECHRAVGDYAYVRIAEGFKGQILGLTASPGGKIEEVKRNLHIDEFLTSNKEPDFTTSLDVVRVPLTQEMIQMRKHLELIFIERVGRLKEFGFLSYKYATFVTKTDLIDAQGRIMAKMKRTRKPYLFAALIDYFVALHVDHMTMLLETQGIAPMMDYFRRLEEKESSRKMAVLQNHPELRKMMAIGRKTAISHPKLAKIAEIVSGIEGKKIIFTQYRSTIPTIEESIAGKKTERFVGQSKEDGMSQAEQAAAIESFRSGETEILIATSVAEEGLDIPDVNLVVFYEPIPSEIRSIQRRGRTGRHRTGKVIILVAEGTRDEAFLKSAEKKEKSMKRFLK